MKSFYIWNYIEGIQNSISIVGKNNSGYVKYPIDVSGGYTFKSIDKTLKDAIEEMIAMEKLEDIKNNMALDEILGVDEE